MTPRRGRAEPWLGDGPWTWTLGQAKGRRGRLWAAVSGNPSAMVRLGWGAG